MTREEAIKKLQKQKNEYLEEWVDYSGVAEAFNMAIQALKNEPKHGRWEFIGATTRGAAIINRYACSECGYEADTTNYCPNCGARMDGGEK